jgi:hypothetical protein
MTLPSRLQELVKELADPATGAPPRPTRSASRYQKQ